MSQLGIIISTEYKTDIKRKSFWISTIIVPLIIMAFSFFAGFMMSESDTAMTMQESLMPGPDGEDISGMQVLGMMLGMFLTIFLMVYGSQIYNKVHYEKANRIVEILATCVEGRTVMLAKIISVGLVGLTQILLWGIMSAVIITGVFIVFPVDMELTKLFALKYVMALVWCMLYFIGGYIFYGSLFAAVGAMSDKNSENQEYMAILTFVLLFAVYLGMYAVDHGSALFVRICEYLPFTSPTVCTINSISGAMAPWESLLSLVVLYGFAYLAMAFSGKIYTSSILLKGKRFTPMDIVTFLKSK